MLQYQVFLRDHNANTHMRRICMIVCLCVYIRTMCIYMCIIHTCGVTWLHMIITHICDWACEYQPCECKKIL